MRDVTDFTIRVSGNAALSDNSTLPFMSVYDSRFSGILEGSRESFRALFPSKESQVESLVPYLNNEGYKLISSESPSNGVVVNSVSMVISGVVADNKGFTKIFEFGIDEKVNVVNYTGADGIEAWLMLSRNVRTRAIIDEIFTSLYSTDLDPITAAITLPTVNNWKERVLSNDGSVSDSTLVRANRFYARLTQCNLVDKICHVNLLSGDNLNAALVPFIDKFEVGPALNFNFTPAEYSEATGLKPSISGRYLNTKILCENCLGTSVWLRDNDATSANSKWIGAQTGTDFFGMGRQSSLRTEVVIGSIASRVIFGEPFAEAGMQHLIKVSDSLRIYYRNGQEIRRNTTLSPQDIPLSRQIFVFAGNSGSPAFYNTTGQLGYSTNTDGMTDEDALNYYNIWAEFNNSRPV